MFDSHLPCRAHAIPDHVILLKATAQQGHRKTHCGLTASVGLHPAITRSSTKLLSEAYQSQMQSGQCETKHRLSWTRKRLVAAHYKKDDLLHCWTSSRIFPATMRTFTKDTALSEQGRGAAWHVWINARDGMGTAWVRRGNSMLCVWIGLTGAAIDELRKLPVFSITKY